MAFVEDKAGVLKSDAHRFVLGVLSLPEDEHAWTLEGVVTRVHPHLNSKKDVELILNELVADNLAELVKDKAYRMTNIGYELLTGPIANEPLPGEPVEGPALVINATPIERLAVTGEES